MAKRKRVYEHRFNRIVHGYLVRFWLESDPEHGGIFSDLDAEAAVDEVIRRFTVFAMSGTGRWNTAAVAGYLLEGLPCANSVEACEPDTPDGKNKGTAVHRDWP